MEKTSREASPGHVDRDRQKLADFYEIMRPQRRQQKVNMKASLPFTATPRVPGAVAGTLEVLALVLWMNGLLFKKMKQTKL